MFLVGTKKTWCHDPHHSCGEKERARRRIACGEKRGYTQYMTQAGTEILLFYGLMISTVVLICFTCSVLYNSRNVE